MAQARTGIIGALGTSLLLLLICLIPAAVNRSPIIYPDSVGYYQSGRAALMWAHLLPTTPRTHSSAPALVKKSTEVGGDDGISTARSVYYGAILALAFSACGMWAVAILQALVCLAAMWLALRHLAPNVPGRVRVGMIAATAGLGGAGAFADTIMPDIFAGLLILASSIFIVYRRRLTAAERLWWIGLALAAILFHKSHLVLAFAILMVGAIINLTTRRGWGRGLLVLIGVILIGAGGHAAIDVAVRKVLHKGPTSPPFVLARMIGDGTAEAFLQETCPRVRFTTCALLPHMPMTENQFLWSRAAGGFASLPAQGRQRVIAEEGAIAIGTLREHGGEQIMVSAGNFMRQLALVGVREYSLAPSVAPASAPGLEKTLARYQARSKAARLDMLGPVSVVIAVSYFSSLGILLYLLLVSRPKNASDDTVSDMPGLAWLVLGGIVANAAICGAISGVFDRYQGRVAWVAMLLALAWAYAAWRSASTPSARAGARLGDAIPG